ncbi:MBL fold metallo-hydrolase [Flavobacterium sp.]|uniref:MBL fold metallo-hydrolase n=1 Tax=Flavobacterium sp. TaxID=239 RepID=UPI003D133B30
MQIEQIYTGCLAQGAYYITSNKEAIIIDPLREIQPYLDRLKRDNVKLKYIFETHFHADFVSGHLDLSKATGAPIVFGPQATPHFDAIIAQDNQIFNIGNIQIKVLHTPGHTMESSTFLLIDENGVDHAIFSGDTLFIGDVGRPDLAQKAANKTQEELASILFKSLRTKILPLNDNIIVYPAHGAGSACGKNMSKETSSTLGEQKKSNYALRINMSEEEFIHEVLDGLTPPPSYFRMNVALNKTGYTNFEQVLKNSLKSFDALAFKEMIENTDALVLDTRTADDFYKNHIPQSINIGLSGDFAPWVGTLIADVKQPLLLICQKNKEEETITRLSRVGFDNVLGILENGFESWTNAGLETDSVHRITAETFAEQISSGNHKIIDVRKETEYAAKHLEEAYNKPLAYINDWINELNPKEHFYLHCAGGYRSMMAASILQARGYRNFTEIEGGFGAISKTELPTTDFVCQSKTL